MGKKKNRRRQVGFSDTRNFPHKNHPANYRKRGDDDIDYVTFTHSDEVHLSNGKKVKTIPLTDNISKKERAINKQTGKKTISYVYPKVFRGKRSALGKENKDYSLVPDDKLIVEKLFVDLPVENVPVTGGANKIRKLKKKKSRK